MMLRGIALVICSLAVLSGCQTVPGDIASQSAPVEPVVVAPAEPAPEVDQPPPPPRDLWQRMSRQMTLLDPDNPEVAKARRHYLKQHNYMQVVAGRGSLFLHYIVEEVERRGMPLEIALLPMVESSFDPFARSSQDAAGLWQIMPSTGRYLGLQQDWWFDGRRDLRQSTRAALDYLEELHQQFDGDWLLALAAYNSGKGRVRRAQRENTRRGRSTDYWSLKLPRETRRYVPRLLAVAELVANADDYDITLPAVANEPVFDVVPTGGQIEIRRAADLGSVPLLDLRMLNAGQRRWATSPDQRQELLVPLQAAERMERQLASLAPEDRVQWQYYRIRRGDSLIKIAKQFNTEVALLRQANGIRGSMIRAGDQLMIPSGADWADSLALADTGERRRRGYRVQRGDSLYRIAGRFNVSIDEIVSWNSLDPEKYLQPGQQLTLYLHDG